MPIKMNPHESHIIMDRNPLFNAAYIGRNYALNGETQIEHPLESEI
jgi:hypothetical protein